MMGITETIAGSLEDYVATAVRLGQDKEWRNEVRRAIATNRHRVCRDRACIAALEDFLDTQARRVRPE
jgi:predicted O-linked N-acetylglucosamine transferase (SPINDLY family)